MSRKIGWIVVAGLGLGAGCSGTDGQGPGPGPGPGDDAGTSGCMVSSDCERGQVCSPDTGTCVAAKLAIDMIGFFDDGTRWLSGQSGPMLTGTIDETNTEPLRAYIDGVVIAELPVVANGRWSLQLADGSIKTADTTVTLRAGTIEASQVFALDAALPHMAALATTVRDERGDAITFPTTGPMHTHAGAAITLGTGCPSVYKYGYLLGVQAPIFGTEASPNPLTFSFHPDGHGIDPQTAEYRVRSDASTVLDWTPATVAPNGDLTAAVYRDGQHAIAELGTQAKKYYIDVRVQDWQHREAMGSTCWDHHPMAAPLQLTAPVAATLGDALGGWSLLANSPISHLMFGPGGANVFQSRLIQSSAEPTHVQLTFAVPAGTFTEEIVNEWVPSGSTTVSVPCGTTAEPGTDPQCTTTAIPALADSSPSGALDPGTWAVGLYEATTMQSVPCTISGCEIPGRAIGAPPHEYVVLTYVLGLNAIDPIPGGTGGEYTIGGLTYTGSPVTATTDRCTNMATISVPGGFSKTCRTVTTYSKMTAIDRLTLNWAPLRLNLQTTFAGATNVQVPSYLPNGITGAAFAWDSGDDDLPGSR
jgi:hypothetical protein